MFSWTFETDVIKNTPSLPESSSFKVEDRDGPASGPAWQAYKHHSSYENKHRCSELCKSFLTVLLGDDITGLIFEFGIGVANKVTLLLSHALIYCNWPPGSFGTRDVHKFRFKVPAVCGPPQKWFSAEMLIFALTLNALEGYLFLGPTELMETYLHGKAGCSLLCGSTKCPSWRAVSRLSQQQAFLSLLWPRKSCVWVPFCGPFPVQYSVLLWSGVLFASRHHCSEQGWQPAPDPWLHWLHWLVLLCLSGMFLLSSGKGVVLSFCC